MNKNLSLSGLKESVVLAIDTMAVGATAIGKVLFASVGHDAIWPQRSLSACIEQGRLSVIYGRRAFSRISIKGAKFYPGDRDKYPTPEALVTGVKFAAADWGAPTKDVTLVVPRPWAFVRTVELPSTVKADLSRAVAFELDRFTPLSAEDALYDFFTVSEKEDKLQLFLAVSRNDLVSPYIGALADQGVKVGRIVTSLSAMAACCGYLVGGERTIFAEVRPDGYDGAVLVDGRTVVAFGNAFNGEGTDERSRSVKEGMENAAACAGEETGLTTAVMLADKGISPAAITLSMATPVILNGLDRTRLHMKRSVPDLSLAESGSIVQSLWPKAKGIDLLAKGNRRKSRYPVAVTVLLLAAIVAMAVIYVATPLNIERRRLAEIERQIKAMKTPVRQVEALKKEIDLQEKENEAIENFKKNHILTVDILREITTLLPKSVWLTRARITEATVDLEGYAGSAAEILPKLEASPFLKKVEFASPTFRDTRLNADRFVIKMEIENEKKSDTGGLKGGVKK